MDLGAERHASITEHNGVVIAHVGITHRAGHPTIGHNATDSHRINSGASQQPVKLGVEKCRVSHLEHRNVDMWGNDVHIGLTTTAWREVPLAQERTPLQQMGEIIGSPWASGHSVNKLAVTSPWCCLTACATGATRSGNSKAPALTVWPRA